MTIADATPELDIADRNDRAFLGHPRALGYLAFTEAWERFSYYGMQTLLALYLVKVLLLPGHVENIAFFASFRKLYGGLDGQPLASAIFGTYTALVYLTPIFGGLIADRWLGKRMAVLIGAVVMAAGHFLMAFEVSFLFALLCLVIGCGLIKGNLASQVGTLYKPDDLRRADAFQIYYLGINAGVIISPLIVGSLGQGVGWHWGFGAAGVGMLISLCIYLAGQKYLPRADFGARRGGHPVTTAAETGDAVPPPSRLTRADIPALAAVLLLIPVMAVAIVPNNQIFNVYLVWGDARFSLSFFGVHFLSSWLVTIDAIVSVSFLLLVALFYRWYGKRHQEPDELTKIIIGSVFSIAGMMCLAAANLTTPADAKISMFWPMMFELLNSIAFAHMLPVSLALFARLAPRALHATVIGFYYLAFFGANTLVGWVGGFYETMNTTSFWLLHAALAGGAGLVFLFFKLALAPRLMPAEAKT